MPKRIAAVAMSSRIGETFDAIVTGVTLHGTFVRVLKSAVEGLLAQGQQGADVGDRLHVKLTRTNIQRGYIDFVRDHARADLRTAAQLPAKNMASGRSYLPQSMIVHNWTDTRPEYRYHRAWIRWNVWRPCPLRSDCTR